MEDDLAEVRRRIHRALNQAGERRSIASDAARDRAEPKGNQFIRGADFDDSPDRQRIVNAMGRQQSCTVLSTQVLLALRSIDFQGKGFATMWTGISLVPSVAFVVTLRLTFSRRLCRMLAKVQL